MWSQITVTKQLLSLHKTPIICDHIKCDHVFKNGEKVTRKHGHNKRYFCPNCAESPIDNVLENR